MADYNLKKLDEIDCEILKILQNNADLGLKDLSLLLDRSAATIHARIRKLKDSGIILKTVTIVDRKKVGFGVLAIAEITLRATDKISKATFEHEIAKIPEVTNCWQIEGSIHFILRITARDMEEYSQVIRGKLLKVNFIERIQTYFVLSEAKSNTAFDLFDETHH